MKDNKITAKVNKEIGGWDYRGYHIARNKELKRLDIELNGSVIDFSEALGEAKAKIDEMLERAMKAFEEKKEEHKVEPAEVKRDLENASEIEFTSKKGIKYLLTIRNGKVRAFTYENGKKVYWSVTKEIQKFMEPYMA